MARNVPIFLLLVLPLLFGSACGSRRAQAGSPNERVAVVDKEFTLTARVGDGRIFYVGVGGEIDGQENPDLAVQAGDTVRITLVGGDGMPHDVFIPDFNVKTPLVSGEGNSVEVVFTLDQPAGQYSYFCTQPGHRQAGQEGLLIVLEDDEQP